MKHSVQKSNRDLNKLHNRTPSEGRVLYPPKPGMEVEAAAAWKSTGVCVKCSARAISCGRCLMCGEVHS